MSCCILCHYGCSVFQQVEFCLVKVQKNGCEDNEGNEEFSQERKNVVSPRGKGWQWTQLIQAGVGVKSQGGKRAIKPNGNVDKIKSKYKLTLPKQELVFHGSSGRKKPTNHPTKKIRWKLVLNKYLNDTDTYSKVLAVFIRWNQFRVTLFVN